MKIRTRFHSLLMGLICLPALGHAGSNCSVESSTGASLPQGAMASMRVINNGRECSIRNWGVPADHENPAETGKILQPPAHGTAEFVAPRARYKPEAGYTGDDEFVYEALATDRGHRPLRLLVHVKVTVLPP